ncbi:MAG: CU044_2847 family protein [Nostoc sp.]|uniref:CU044_2847 family protein n=1 Tax=Nostoc sp. TaxID=1180 RepID=UPI002FF84845
MSTKLIRLDDGTLVEVEVPEEQARQISGGFADKVDATFDKIKPILVKTCKPIAAAWKEINQEMNIEQAEVQIGLSFEGEGNLYITKSKASANLTIKLVLKPNSDGNLQG